MWLQKWIWERYKELRLKIGINIDFTFEKAKKTLSYDSNQTIYKILNELEESRIIKVERLGKDKRQKKYRIVLDLKDIPYSYLSIPSDYQAEEGFLTSTGSTVIEGMPLFLSGEGKSLPKLPSKAFDKIYNKESKQFVTIVPEKASETIEEYLIENIKSYKSAEPILSIIKKQKIDFDEVIKELNSYQKRYLGALLEVLNKDKYKEIIDKLYELTKNDKRKFSIFSRKVKKIPDEYKEIAKKWRIYLNIDKVDIDEL